MFDKHSDEHLGHVALDDVDDDEMRALWDLTPDDPLLYSYQVTERSLPYLGPRAAEPLDLERYEYYAEQVAVPDEHPMGEVLDDPEANDVYNVLPDNLRRLRREAEKRGFRVFDMQITWCESEADFVATAFGAVGAPPQYEPTWQGLIEALTDLSWAPAPGWVLIVEFKGDPDPDEAYAAWYDALHVLQQAAFRWDELFHKPFDVAALGSYRATWQLPDLV